MSMVEFVVLCLIGSCIFWLVQRTLDAISFVLVVLPARYIASKVRAKGLNTGMSLKNISR